MKFGPVHPRANTDPERYNFAPSDTLIGFAGSHPMLVRGHTLVWHKQISDWVVKGHFDSRALNAILQDHIRTVVSHFGNKVYAWDVVNEAFDDDGTMRSTLWYDQPGMGYAGQGTKYIEKALAWAKAVNPGAKLFYNHYDAEVVNPKSDAIYAMAQGFVRRGVPLNGVGFQMHVDLSFDN